MHGFDRQDFKVINRGLPLSPQPLEVDMDVRMRDKVLKHIQEKTNTDK